MCRMPIPQNDENFGNIYSSDGMSRPKEIVWDCGYNEHCCGYECCPGSGGYGGYNGYYNHGMRGFGIGYGDYVIIISTFLLIRILFYNM